MISILTNPVLAPFFAALLAVAVTGAISLWLERKQPSIGMRSKLNLQDKHVLITGGSTGIGLALAIQFAKLGAAVTVLARSATKLKDAEAQIQAARPGAKVQSFSTDVKAFEQVQAAVAKAEQSFGAVDVVVPCAGASHPARFVEQDIAFFEQDMQLNYFGTLYTLKVVVPGMTQRKRGRVLFVTSVCATIGFAGMASYTPTKYALKGLADTLRNELIGTGVQLHVAYPMDTQTPGFEEENKTKPPECHAISRISGEVNLFTADQAASSIMKGFLKGQYSIKTPDFFSNLLITSMSNVTPRMYPLIVEMLIAPLIVVAQGVFRWLIDREVEKVRRVRQP